jgi:hypothetical protein
MEAGCGTYEVKQSHGTRGNTHILPSALEGQRREYGLERVVEVGDGGQ